MKRHKRRKLAPVIAAIGALALLSTFILPGVAQARISLNDLQQQILDLQQKFQNLTDQDCPPDQVLSGVEADGTVICSALIHPQCLEPYTTITDANRLTSNTSLSPPLCDNGLAAGWYRFDVGSGMLPETAPPFHRCQTQAPGWLNGAHPAPIDGVVDRQVCYQLPFDFNTTCGANNNIKVVSCGSFFLYELQAPPFCLLRYCVAP